MIHVLLHARMQSNFSTCKHGATCLTLLVMLTSLENVCQVYQSRLKAPNSGIELVGLSNDALGLWYAGAAGTPLREPPPPWRRHRHLYSDAGATLLGIYSIAQITSARA